MSRLLAAVRLEFALFLVLALGILIGNRDAVQIGFRSLYVVETVTLLVGLTMLAKTLAVPHIRSLVRSRLQPGLIPVFLVLLIGAAELIRSDWTTYAVRQSVINFYAFFVLVFVFAMTRRDLLLRFLYICLTVGSLFIAAKLFWYTVNGVGYREEEFRVLHNEVDVIAIPIAFMGLLVCRKALWAVSKPMYVLLFAATSFALIAPFKRTSFIALGLCGVVYLLVMGRRLRWKPVAAFVAVCAALPAVGWALLALVRPDLLAGITAFIARKLDIFHEGNASWRWLAWRVAWQKFLKTPIFGNGFGQQILDTRVWYVDTFDPHNSYLAFLVHNGIVGGLALLALLVIAAVKYVRLIRRLQGHPDVDLVVFYFLSFTFVLFFPLFNVMLENQYQSIFYWFFVAGPFYLGHLLESPSPEPAWTPRERSIDAVAVVALAAYVGLVVSPLNYTRVIDVYSTSAHGQNPSVYESEGEAFAKVRDVMAKRIRFEVKADPTDAGIHVTANKQEGFAGLTWVLPHVFRIYRVPDLAKYALVVDYAAPPAFAPVFTLRNTAHEARSAQSETHGQTARVWLREYMADGFLDDPSEVKFCLELPSTATRTDFTITGVSIRHEDAL